MKAEDDLSVKYAHARLELAARESNLADAQEALRHAERDVKQLLNAVDHARTIERDLWDQLVAREAAEA